MSSRAQRVGFELLKRRALLAHVGLDLPPRLERRPVSVLEDHRRAAATGHQHANHPTVDRHARELRQEEEGVPSLGVD